jgi:putative acetyltransferase
MMIMIRIRPERTEDIESIRELTISAFQGDEEARLIVAIRASDYFIPELSLVASQKRSYVILNTVG